jgi:hypothetical protein
VDEGRDASMLFETPEDERAKNPVKEKPRVFRRRSRGEGVWIPPKSLIRIAGRIHHPLGQEPNHVCQPVAHQSPHPEMWQDARLFPIFQGPDAHVAPLSHILSREELIQHHIFVDAQINVGHPDKPIGFPLDDLNRVVAHYPPDAITGQSLGSFKPLNG